MMSFLKAVVRWVLRIAFGLLFILGWSLALLALHFVVVPEPAEVVDSTDAAVASTTDSTDIEIEGDSGEGNALTRAGGWVAAKFDGWKLVIVPKNRLGLKDTYVDTRHWTAQDAGEHEEVVTRLLEAGKGQLLDHVIERTVRGQFDDLLSTRNELLDGDE